MKRKAILLSVMSINMIPLMKSWTKMEKIRFIRHTTGTVITRGPVSGRVTELGLSPGFTVLKNTYDQKAATGGNKESGIKEGSAIIERSRL